MDVSNISFNGEIFLEGLEEIDIDCARLLANSSRGGTLCIGLRSMSDEVASELLRSKSESFIMNRLEELTPHAADVCCRFIHATNIEFRGLQRISEEALELLLADFTDKIEGWCHGSIYLNGLEELTPRMQKAIKESKHEVNLNEKIKIEHQ